MAQGWLHAAEHSCSSFQLSPSNLSSPPFQVLTRLNLPTSSSCLLIPPLTFPFPSTHPQLEADCIAAHIGERAVKGGLEEGAEGAADGSSRVYAEEQEEDGVEEGASQGPMSSQVRQV